LTFVGSISGSSSGSTSPLNTSSISGLASGIDTESIVNGLMQAAQIPLISALQQRQTLQWKSENYQQVNTSLSALQNALSNMKLQSTFLTQTTTSSNSQLVSATIGANAANGTYSVSVSQLAQGATISSANILSTDPTYADTPLANLANNPLGTSSTSTSISVSVNGKSFTFNPQTDTINTVLKAFSSDPSSGVTAFYDSNAGKVVMQTSTTGSGAQINVTNDTAGLFQNVLGLAPSASATTGTFSTGQLSSSVTGVVEINGQKFQFQPSETLANVAGDINKLTASTGVTATVDSTNSFITLSGASLYAPISVSDPNNTLQMATTTPVTAAHDAVYSVNGVNSTSPTNSPVFNGVIMNLQGTTTSPVTIGVTSNVSGVVQTITNFVQQYNQTLQTMQGLYNQTRNFSYNPLTSDQEAKMTQTQIDQWNVKAQSGLLNGDTLLGGAMHSLENAAMNIVNGLSASTQNGQSVTLNSLSSIGISPISVVNGVSAGSTAPGVTTSGYNTYGLLQINTTKLTAAVQANPSAVMNLFTNNPALTGGSTDPTQQGLAVQMYNAVSSSVSQITQEAGPSTVVLPTTPNTDTGSIVLPSTAIDPNADLNSLFSSDGYDTSFLGQQISMIDTRNLNFQKQLTTQKQQYETQFSQMEAAIQQINSQSSSLISMLGGSGLPSGG